MRILVTGALGFVGRHLIKALTARPLHYVTPVDLPRDARDFFRTDDHRFDVVYHCAAHVGGRADIDGRPAYLQAVNSQLDGAMFEWALRTRPGRVVYFSSSAAYPAYLQQRDDMRGYKLREDDIELDAAESPESTYGWTKLAGEVMARAAVAEGLRVHLFRPFSGYGTDQALSYPFPAFIDRAQRRCDPFEVWGDGTQVRDWIHIDDVVGAVLAAVEYDVDGAVNLCSGEGTSMAELAELITQAAGYTPEIAYKPDAPRGVDYRVGDPSRMREFYTPRVNLDQGIKRALEGEW